MSDNFKDLFSGRSSSYSNLCVIFTYFLFGKSSLSDLVRSTPWSNSVSDLSRAINAVNAPRWMRRHRKSVLKNYKGKFNPNDFCLVLDDTDNPKFGGSHRAARWFGSKGFYNGQRIVVLALVDIKKGYAIPLSYEIATKINTPGFMPAPKIGIKLLKQLIGEGFPTIFPVVCDSWFDGVPFLTAVNKLGFELVWELKANRRVKSNPGKLVEKVSLKQIFADMQRFRLFHRLETKAIKQRKKKRKCGSQKRILINELNRYINCVAMYNRRNGANAFGYWSSTNLNRSPDNVWELSRARWKIECLFRDLKQNLSFGRLPVGSEEGANVAICVPLILYTALKMKPEYWECQKDQSIGRMTAQIKETSLQKSIDNIIEFPDSLELKKLRSRRSKKRCCRKPVDIDAESFKSFKLLVQKEYRKKIA